MVEIVVWISTIVLLADLIYLFSGDHLYSYDTFPCSIIFIIAVSVLIFSSTLWAIKATSTPVLNARQNYDGLTLNVHMFHHGLDGMTLNEREVK